MNIGFIGAGRAGCSLGKYISEFCIKNPVFAENTNITGYYSSKPEDAQWAADFTNSACFADLNAVVTASDTIVISTPDGAVMKVWDSLIDFDLRGKIICHLSGSLSSDVFSINEVKGFYPVSVHPLFAFSNKDSIYKQLNKAGFTLEGHEYAVNAWKNLLSQLGNKVVEIDGSVKAKYHAAASILSNHVLAVLATGYELLEECGFSSEEARSFTKGLVSDNIANAIEKGCVESLTGPIERNDIATVNKHLSVLSKAQKEVYHACGNKLLQISAQKNPKRDYSQICELLK
ncbi:MAG: DUF2520 domain-containing protein [Lachnospiraceae bacterium]|nr:DUF2520 domain-containing protein [Lachnospiraceae bacterium]MBQ2406350.1 DUF2520 domain-containing protein [Lachnospiraceae bacterium]MBQ5849670.1 DUF2520 domain-containing protein [Lachnospiraceae bacterium]MEE0919540.1 DUF2520 domain-containing protein [Lachnospiraceae bacterium]